VAQALRGADAEPKHTKAGRRRERSWVARAEPSFGKLRHGGLTREGGEEEEQGPAATTFSSTTVKASAELRRVRAGAVVAEPHGR
jgi:hypothetical protein